MHVFRRLLLYRTENKQAFIKSSSEQMKAFFCCFHNVYASTRACTYVCQWEILCVWDRNKDSSRYSVRIEMVLSSIFLLLLIVLLKDFVYEAASFWINSIKKVDLLLKASVQIYYQWYTFIYIVRACFLNETQCFCWHIFEDCTQPVFFFFFTLLLVQGLPTLRWPRTAELKVRHSTEHPLLPTTK